MMPSPLRVLVTGVSGDVGQAVIKALRLSTESVHCDGCDSDASGAGAAFVERFSVVPRADDPAYLEELTRVCRAWNVDAVIPASEAEIAVLGRLGQPPALPSGTAIVCQPWPWVERYGDKLRCMEQLSVAVPLAPFADGADRAAVERLIAQAGFPVVVKARRSYGSRSLRIAQERTQLAEALRHTDQPMVQALLDGEGEEFSVGAFGANGWLTTIAFRRRLGPSGCSWVADMVEDADVLDYAAKVARASALQGSANIQVRKTHHGVRLLELNPRFSSLAAARAACGFRDVEWSLRLALGRLIERPSGAYQRLRFQRFFHELIDTGEGFRAVAEWMPASCALSMAAEGCR